LFLLGMPYISGWWFQTFFIFHNIWDNPSHWLIFFRGIETTNQIRNDWFPLKTRQILELPAETILTESPPFRIEPSQNVQVWFICAMVKTWITYDCKRYQSINRY
jgi:hypothetical protein